MTVPLPSKSRALPAPKPSVVSGVPDGSAKRRLPSMIVRRISVEPVGISRRVMRISLPLWKVTWMLRRCCTAMSRARAISPITSRIALSAFMTAREVLIWTRAIAISTIESEATTRTSTREYPRSPSRM
jgi:hypothetical protein